MRLDAWRSSASEWSGLGRTMKNSSNVAVELRKHLVPMSQLIPDPSNVRKHPARSIEAIQASLRRFGQQKPIVVDLKGVVVAGNGMLEAARGLGWTHMAAVQTKLSGPERVAYAIADNRTGELSEWDEEALRDTLASLSPDDAAAAGYTPDELGRILNAAADLEDDEGPPDPLPKAVSRLGDLWHLGEHRILCGDSTKLEDVERVMAGEKASLVATDPPYLVDYTGERVGGSGKDWSSSYREVDIKDADKFFRSVFTAAVAVMAPGCAVYCWMAHRRMGEVQAVWRDLEILDHQSLIWVKPSSVFGACVYHFQHEQAMMGWKKGSKPPNYSNHAYTTVWTVNAEGRQVPVDEQSDVWAVDFDGKGRNVGNEHPTQKPLEIFARPMRVHTRPGDLVFEPFSGSGSQLVAAEKLGRCCRAIEVSPVFVDVAIRRWQTLTGQPARLEGKRGWQDVAKARGVKCLSSPRNRAATKAVPSSRERDTAKRTPRSTSGRGKPPPRAQANAGTVGTGNASDA